MKKIVLLAMGVVASAASLAQDTIETTISADVVSNYYWRGNDAGHVSLQPTLGVAYKGLSLLAWGSVGLSDSNDTRELDLTVAYNIGGLNIGITDYWFNKGGLDPEGRYLKYGAHGTNHVFEANIGYDFGFASLQWFTNFTGNDYKENGKRAYSSYCEASVPFRLGKIDWTATLGAVPYASGQYGTDGFAVTNVALKATKSIRVTDSFSVPLFGLIAANPRTQHFYLVFGFTLQP